MAENKQTKGAFDPKKILTGSGAGQSRLAFTPDQIVYAQGSPADAMFYVESGWVKISAITPNGKEAVVALRGAGEFFGSRCLVGRRAGMATTITPCALISVTTQALIRLLREEPDFAVMFATYLAHQAIQDQENIVDHLINPAEKRLARTLLLLANALEVGEPQPIPTRINQETLANMVGTTRSRISVFMNKFKREGHIHYDRNGQVTVHASLRSAVLNN